MTATCYHGHRTDGGAEVLAHNAIGGVRWPLRHVVKHSPAGFNWGYGGSGPADLARSLLIDALGDGATCPTCQGRRLLAWPLDAEHEVPFDPQLHTDAEAMKCLCSDGFRQLPYHDFKFAVVAGWQLDNWRIGRAEIIAWLLAAGCDVPEWTSGEWLDRLAREASAAAELGGAL